MSFCFSSTLRFSSSDDKTGWQQETKLSWVGFENNSSNRKQAKKLCSLYFELYSNTERQPVWSSLNTKLVMSDVLYHSQRSGRLWGKVGKGMGQGLWQEQPHKHIHTHTHTNLHLHQSLTLWHWPCSHFVTLLPTYYEPGSWAWAVKTDTDVLHAYEVSTVHTVRWVAFEQSLANLSEKSETVSLVEMPFLSSTTIHGWDQAKVWTLNAEKSHSKCISQPCLLLSRRFLNPEYSAVTWKVPPMTFTGTKQNVTEIWNHQRKYPILQLYL